MPSNPHDALFRFTFGQTENAAGLLQSCLPHDIATRIDWASLALTNASHVDASAAWRHSDLVFTARIDGRDAFVFVLMEHQSSADPLMPMRMLGYVVRVWEAYLRDRPDVQQLPAVLPVVVYHGATSWNAPTRLLDLIDLDAGGKAAFASYLPDLRFVLDDLAAQGEEQIRRRPLPVGAMLTALSLLGFPRREALGILQRLAQLFAALPRTHQGTETLAAVVCYFLEVADPEPDPEQIRRFFEANVSKTAAEVAMSAAGRLREQGREQGRQQGLAEGEARGRAAMLLNQLTLKFGEPSAATRERVSKATVDELDAFAARVLGAQSLRDVFDAAPASRAVLAARSPRPTSKTRAKKR